MQALKAMLFGAKLPPQEEEPPQPVKPAAARPKWSSTSARMPPSAQRNVMETMPAMAACAALLQAAVALLNAQNYQASSFTLLSGIAALGLFLALLGDRVLLASVQGGFKLAQAGPEHRGAFRAKDKDLIRILSKDMDEKDPWVLLSRPAEWDDAMVEQGFGPRACERRARKTNYILLVRSSMIWRNRPLRVLQHLLSFCPEAWLYIAHRRT